MLTHNSRFHMLRLKNQCLRILDISCCATNSNYLDFISINLSAKEIRMSSSTPYIVKRGDTLWDLAGRYLNDSTRWPEIWHFNNQQYSSPDIRTKLKPSHHIDNPDLIFVGQKILIPTGDSRRQTIKPNPGEKGNTPAKNKARLIPYKYKLERNLFESYLPGGFKATLTIKGAITIQSEKIVDWVEFNREEFDIKVAREYQTPLNKLVSEYQLGVNEKTKQIDFSCGVTINSKVPYATKFQSKVSLNPLTGMPKYTTTITYPEIKGKLNEYFYTATGYSVSIEIEKQENIARRVPASIPVRQPVAVKASPRDQSPDWVYAAGILLMVGAAVIVVATVAEDIITVGGGLADDPASFALAATMTSRGWALLRGAQVAVTQLGRTPFLAPAIAH
jgi:hypothetical protein